MGEINEKKEKNEFISKVMVGSCPVCNSQDTRDCEYSPLNDSTIGLCEECHAMWCLECGIIFKNKQTKCDHWGICENCKFQDQDGICTANISAQHCSIINDARNANKKEKMMKVKIDWAKTKHDLIGTSLSGLWVITNDYKLIKDDPFAEIPDDIIKDEIMVVSRAVYHTTDFLRLFCNEHHPEVDFDEEFETDQPGVFGRYQEKFGHDYEEGVFELEYKNLEEALAAKGYELSF